jgi:hypothetical protein
MKKKKNNDSPVLNDTIPHQINSPDFKGANMKMQAPFTNKHGVRIGDSLYNSESSPLNNWSDDVDPAIMAGDEWVHPTNDIGWNTSENREMIEQNIPSQGVPFMHSTKDVSYSKD